MRKNKLLFIVLSVVLLSTCLLFACASETFTVEFDVDGQTFTTLEVKKGGKTKLPNQPLKSGYLFDGWYLDDGAFTQPFNETTPVINNIKVYAKWVKIATPTNTFVVTFDPQGGTMEQSKLTVRQGEPFTLPEPPTRKDFNFVGWYLDTAGANEFTEDYAVKSNLTVYAVWEAADSTAYFVRSGTTITGLTEKAKGVNSIKLPAMIDGMRITNLGDGVFKNNKDIVSIEFPASSSYAVIGKEAFMGCTSLKTVKFINSITTVGEAAFSGCTSLQGVQFSTALKSIPKNLFYNCTSLEYATISKEGGISEIGDGAFFNCFKLTSIVIYDTVTKVGNEAFSGCSKLSSIKIEEGVKELGNKAFYNCVALTSFTVPDSVIKFGESVFYGCKGLKTATLGNGVKSIPKQTFFGATNLETLTVRAINDVEAIGEGAFYDCNNLSNFTMPQNVTTIGSRAFSRCFKLTSVHIPDGVTKIASQTFESAQGITTLDLNNVTEIGANAFQGCKQLTNIVSLAKITKIGAEAFKGCEKLDNVILPSTLSVVSDGVFNGCGSLKEIVVSDGVKTIEQKAFMDCVSLEEIVLPNTLESVGAYAFSGAIKLTRIVISKSVNAIEATAFSGCTMLVSIEVDSQNPYFESEGGVLYTKGKQDIIFYSSALTAETLTLPSTLKSIYPNVFKGNTSVKTVVAPQSLEYIGDGAFDEATSLESFNFTENLKYIGERAFAYTKIPSAVLPIGLVEISKEAFTGNGSLTRATLPITLLSISKYVFADCNPALVVTVEGDEEDLSGWSSDWKITQEINALNVTYGEGRVTSSDGSYEYFARNGKAVLTKYLGEERYVTVPETIDGVEVVGLYKTFRGCTEILSLIVPNTVDVISELSFKGLTKLETLSVPFVGGYRNAVGVAGLLGYAFDYSESSINGGFKQVAEGGSYASYYVEIPKSLKYVSITDAEVIAYGALSNCHEIISVTLPSNLKHIKGKAFYHCSLVTVTLPASLEIIEKEAFTYNYKRFYDTTEGAPSPAVTFNTSLSTRPEAWVDGCFDEGAVLNFGV